MADRSQTAQPLQSRFILALPRHLARRTDAAVVGVQPYTDQQLRVRMLAPGVALDRSNLCVIESQVEPAYQFPKRTRTVVLVDQLLNINGTQQDLPAINGNQSRSWRRRRICHTRSVRTSVHSAIVYGVPWSISSQLPDGTDPNSNPLKNFSRSDREKQGHSLVYYVWFIMFELASA